MDKEQSHTAVPCIYPTSLINRCEIRSFTHVEVTCHVSNRCEYKTCLAKVCATYLIICFVVACEWTKEHPADICMGNSPPCKSNICKLYTFGFFLLSKRRGKDTYTYLCIIQHNFRHILIRKNYTKWPDAILSNYDLSLHY